MSTRNQNRQPIAPLIDGGGEDLLNKHRKISSGGIARATASSRARKALSTLSSNQQYSSTVASPAPPVETPESLDFTRGEIEALLNEKIKAKKNDFKGTLELVSKTNKRLKLCVKWFQGIEQNLIKQQEALRNLLDASEKKCAEIDAQRKRNEDELNASIGELRLQYPDLEGKFARGESDKLDAIESHKREAELRVAAESSITSLSQELEKVKQEKMAADGKVL